MRGFFFGTGILVISQHSYTTENRMGFQKCCRTGDVTTRDGLNQKCENIQIFVEP